MIAIAALVLIAPFLFRLAGFAGFAVAATAASACWLALAARGGFRAVRLQSVLIIALLIRIPFWFFAPDLSGDVWRYLWDGRVSLSGLSPYVAPPDDPSLVHLRGEWHGKINHPEIATIYPPYAQLLFLIPAIGGGSLLMWRALLLLFEIVALTCLYRSSPRNAVLWALFPLAIWEGHWSAHVDVAAATMLLLAVYALGRPALSGAALGMAAGIKLIPAVALPAMLWTSRTRGRMILAFSAVLAIVAIPFIGGALMPGLRDYSRSWSFNGPVYLPLVRLVELLRLDAIAKSVWTTIKDPLALESISATVYGLLYPAFIARGALGLLLLAGLVLVIRRAPDPPTATADSVGLLLILSPTVHPWYWLPVAILALFAERQIWLYIACGSLLSYLLYVPVSPWVVLVLSYGIPLAVWRWEVGRGAAKHTSVPAN